MSGKGVEIEPARQRYGKVGDVTHAQDKKQQPAGFGNQYRAPAGGKFIPGGSRYV